MRTTARCVLVMTHPAVLRPGGGPSGYGYNLQQGFATLGADWPHQVDFAEPTVMERSTSDVESGSTTIGRRVTTTIRAGLLPFYTAALERSVSFQRYSRRVHLDRMYRRRLKHYDVIVLNGFQGSSAIRYLRRRTRARIVYMPHSPTPAADEFAMYERASGGTLPKRLYDYFLQDEAALLRGTDAVVFPCAEAGDPYRSAFQGLARTWRELHAVSGVPDVGSALYPLPGGQGPRLVFMGRYVDHKGYDVFLEAARQLNDATCTSVSMGAGPIPTADPVIDLGWQDQPHALLRRGDVAVIPNRVAYFDLLPLECAALGLPLVLTPVGGNVAQQRLLPDTVLSSSPSPADVAAAARLALRRLQEDPSWGSANREAFLRHFTVEQMARQWSTIFASI